MSSRSIILVVDDDESIRDFVHWALTAEGYAVETVRDGSEALDFIRDRTPDLILLDLRMPVVDGWAFARTYRERPGPHAPIVVMAAVRADHNPVAEIGAVGFLDRPFDLDDLFAVAERHTAARR